MSSDTEFIAAVVSRLKAQQDAFERLASAVESSLADMTGALEKPGIERALGAIEQGMADMVAAMERPDDTGALDRLTAAVAGLNLTATVNVPPAKAPVVNVQVSPTPVTIEAVMPPQPAPEIHNHIAMPPASPVLGTWEVRLPGNGYNAPDRVMTITRKS